MQRIDYRKKHSLGRFNPRYAEFYAGRGRGRLSCFEMYVEFFDEQADEDGLFDIAQDMSITIVEATTNSRGTKKVVFELELSYNGDNGCHQVEMACMDKLYTGFGFAPLFYRWLMQRLDVSLEAGTMQSPGGRYIWASLADLRNIVVIALDRRGNMYDVYNNEEGELESDEVKLYDGRKHVSVLAKYERKTVN